MNIQWQDFNEHRDSFIKRLERQLSQAAEKTKCLGTDRPSEVEDLQLTLKVETQARTRAEATVKHLTNRLNEMVRQLENEKKKVCGLEEVIQQITNSRNVENEDSERIKVLEEQVSNRFLTDISGHLVTIYLVTEILQSDWLSYSRSIT